MQSVKNDYHKKDIAKVIELQQGRVLPNAIDLEQAVLGSFMIDKRCIDECILVVKISDVFYDLKHKVIFEAIQALHFESKPIDILTVADQLSKMGILDVAGGNFYLIDLTQKISSSAHAEFHCRLLMQFYIKRQMIRDAAELTAKAYDDEFDCFDLINEAAIKVDALNEVTGGVGSDLTMHTGMDLIQKRLEFLSQNEEGTVTGFKTGFRKVDKLTSGWQPTDLIIIGARPGMGKTSYVMKCLLDNAMWGTPVGFVSCEMSTQQLMTRMVACASHFHLNQLFREGFSHSKYWNQFAEIKRLLQQLPAHFDDRSTDVYDVVAKIRLWNRKFGVRVVIIDYLQQMSCKSVGKNGLREQEIATITRTLKKLAKELDISIILLSQLSRKVDERSDKRPQLSDLRESGAIEQDADVVAFLYRPSYYGLEPDDDMKSANANAEFIIAKNRNGSIDRRFVYFDENKTKFMDPEDFEQEQIKDKELSAVAFELPKISANEAFGTSNKSDIPF